MANPSRMKREIDKAKKERAAEKRERRQRAADAEPGSATATTETSALPNDEVLDQLERIHAQFAAEEIDFDEFERAKELLLAQLTTD
ncbi:MAG TPA: hypothetical protein VMK16_06275 [Acidimicrobiales bacterium]|nr:hypothetical protein [Acidimicrobiales bacterium]